MEGGKQRQCGRARREKQRGIKFTPLQHGHFDSHQEKKADSSPLCESQIQLKLYQCQWPRRVCVCMRGGKQRNVRMLAFYNLRVCASCGFVFFFSPHAKLF